MTFLAHSCHTPAWSSEIFGFNDSPQAWAGERAGVGMGISGGGRDWGGEEEQDADPPTANI